MFASSLREPPRRPWNLGGTLRISMLMKANGMVAARTSGGSSHICASSSTRHIYLSWSYLTLWLRRQMKRRQGRRGRSGSPLCF